MEYGHLYLTTFQRKLLLKKLYDDALSQLNRQRIKIMILADQGIPQSEICTEVGCCSSTARHWIHMARSGMAHLWEESPRGRPKVVTDAYLERLGELLSQSPRDYKYPFARWTADWLRKHLAQEYGIEISLRHFKRLLKQVKDAQNFKAAIKQPDILQLQHNRTDQGNALTNLDSKSSLKIADLTLEGKQHSFENPSTSLTYVEKKPDLYGNFNT
jgi:transposase